MDTQNGSNLFSDAHTKFSLELFQRGLASCKNENVLVSPLSAALALALAAGGAKGETLAGMEQALGGLPLRDLQSALSDWKNALPESEECRLKTADSVWIREGLRVREVFLKQSGAEIFTAPFDDSTVREINAWCSRNTDGMIPEILRTLSPDLRLCIINAVLFDAKWEVLYKDDDIQTEQFTDFRGRQQETKMMFSHENSYLSDGRAEGFLKHYRGHSYAFAALLPEEGLSAAEYAMSLTPQRLRHILETRRYADVRAGIPVFQTDFSAELKPILAEMGMTQAFAQNADFSGITEEPLKIDSILQKTHIEIDPKGTRAAAVTAMLAAAGCAMPIDRKYVILNRPFVYMILDAERNLPFFIGILNTRED